MALEVRSRWNAVYLLDGPKVVREVPFSPDPEAIAERLRRRREGSLAPEEAELMATLDPTSLRTHDRRFLSVGARLVEGAPVPLELPLPSRETLRELLLAAADAALEAAWDPSIHLNEAVRAMTDVDRTINLVGERLASWASRDRPDLFEEDPEAGDRAAQAVVEAPAAEGSVVLPQADPDLLAVRRELAATYHQLKTLRRSLDAAVERSSERRAPNLSALLGPLLAARMVAQAGGLERLARLPSSTVQVLGAENAFFDHLRHGTRPPRHGLLFLHPSIQGAPKRQRGRLARALAGKAAIAARLDLAGKPLDPSLKDAFTRRAEEIRRPPSASKRAGSRSPLDRAAEDR